MYVHDVRRAADAGPGGGPEQVVTFGPDLTPARAIGLVWLTGPRRETMSDSPLLVARGVDKIYRIGTLEVPALRRLDLSVDAGELVGVMGPSGSGKTTLLNCLSGLDDIDTGTVEVDGRDLFAMSDGDRTAHRARAMGFVFQAFNLIPVFTAVENVELPLLLGGVAAKSARLRATARRDRVGLTNRNDHRPAEMSGGEQQRVTIARALVSRPAIVWADEPTGNLDSTMAESVMDLLCELNRDEGQTIVLVTHDPAIGARVPRLVRMRDGELVEDVQRRPVLDLTPTG
jgi:putative ABC transport system ATP-binding protein